MPATKVLYIYMYGYAGWPTQYDDNDVKLCVDDKAQGRRAGSLQGVGEGRRKWCGEDHTQYSDNVNTLFDPTQKAIAAPLNGHQTVWLQVISRY